MLIGFLAAIAIARFRFYGRKTFVVAIIASQMVPLTALVIPLFLLLSRAGLQNKLPGITITYLALTLPLTIWLLRGFVGGIPAELEEAAMVDGCSQVSALLRIVLPVSLPGLITSIIFSFTLSMQDFLYSLAFVSISEQKPVPLGVATELIRGDVFFWGSLMAGALLVGVPVAIIYNLFLDKFISGITGAAIK